MMSTLTKKLIRILGASLALCVIAPTQCPVDTVIVKGRVVENTAAAHSKVRVQLVYPKKKPGESGEVTVEDGAFQIPIARTRLLISIFFVYTETTVFKEITIFSLAGLISWARA
jgi:hypothetical protein